MFRQRDCELTTEQPRVHLCETSFELGQNGREGGRQSLYWFRYTMRPALQATAEGGGYSQSQTAAYESL